MPGGRAAGGRGHRARRAARRWPSAASRPAAGAPGTITQRDLLSGYADHLKTLVDLSGIRPLKVAVDAGNGMAGHTVPKVFEGLPITLVPLYFELDGTFPNHEANPIDPKNLARPAAGGAGAPARTSGWPSTATRTAASWSTSGARSSRLRC